MQTIIKEYKIYKFNELPEEAKQKAIEKLSDINTNYDWWQGDGLIDLSQKECNARHISSSEYPSNCLFSWKEIYFDLGGNQYLQLKDLVVNSDDVFRKFLRIPKKLWQNCQYSFENNRYSYGGEYNTAIIFNAEFENGREFTAKEQAIIDRAIEIFSDKIHEGWKMLKDQYEYLTSEKGIIETIEANDYDFLEDGRIFASCC